MRLSGVFLFCTFVLSIFVSNVWAQSERHSYVTAKEGDLYTLLKVGAPMTLEQMHFMSQVNRLSDLRVLTHMQQMTEQELIDFRNDPSSSTAKYKPAIQPYTKEEIEKYIASTKQFSFTKLENVAMIDTLAVKTFPSLVYLTPDGFIYRFAFKPYDSMKSIQEFWDAYEKHKNQGPKMWLKKKWSIQ